MSSNRWSQYYNSGGKYYTKKVQGELNVFLEEINDSDIPDLCNFLNQHPEITSLNVHSNKITDKGAKLIAAVKTITSLNIGDNYDITDEGIKALAASETITDLDVSGTKVSNEGLKALAASKVITSLRIYYARPQISDEGANILATSETITSLDVSLNHISDEGATALASSKISTYLKLEDNKISDGTKKALAAKFTHIIFEVEATSHVKIFFGDDDLQEEKEFVTRVSIPQSYMEPYKEKEAQISEGGANYLPTFLACMPINIRPKDTITSEDKLESIINTLKKDHPELVKQIKKEHPDIWKAINDPNKRNEILRNANEVISAPETRRVINEIEKHTGKGIGVSSNPSSHFSNSKPRGFVDIPHVRPITRKGMG